MHAADQISFVAAPLAAALVFDASPTLIGLIVGCQSLGQLLGSIPFGLLVERYNSRVTGIAAALTSLLGFGGASLGLASANVVVFALMITLGGFGIVLFVLTALSAIPVITARGATVKANAAIEVPRSVASFVAPVVVGGVITATSAEWLFAAAAAAASASLVVVSRFPVLSPATSRETGRVADLIGGARFIAVNPFLKAITFCALAWNFAFVVLLVAMIPWLAAQGEEPEVFGLALACFGGAAIVGSWLAGRLDNAIRPGAILILGPASSVLAIAVVLTRHTTNSTFSIYVGFFLLGLGPSMWLVVQNTVRQLVTPREMLGRVNAMIQTAIYGARPLSAIAGGVVVGRTSPGFGIALAAGAFACSTAIPLTSALRGIRSYVSLSEPRLVAS